MKLAKVEKVVIGIIFLCLVVIAVNIHSCNKAIDDAGGLDNIAVMLGKEIKDIRKKIDED